MNLSHGRSQGGFGRLDTIIHIIAAVEIASHQLPIASPCGRSYLTTGTVACTVNYPVHCPHVVQYSTVQYSTVQYSTVQYSTVL